MTMLTLFLLAATAAEANVIQETLDQDPRSPWAWVHEEAGHHRIEGGKLQIRALRGSLWKTENNAKNLLVRPWPAEAGNDAAVSVTVTFAPERGGEQAGVMLYFDDDNYVKLVCESLEEKRWVVLAREEKADGQSVAKVEQQPVEMTLRLERDGDRITASYTPAGSEESTSVGECALPPGGEADLKLALIAHGGPGNTDEARWATFSRFRVTKLTRK